MKKLKRSFDDTLDNPQDNPKENPDSIDNKTQESKDSDSTVLVDSDTELSHGEDNKGKAQFSSEKKKKKEHQSYVDVRPEAGMYREYFAPPPVKTIFLKAFITLVIASVIGLGFSLLVSNGLAFSNPEDNFITTPAQLFSWVGTDIFLFHVLGYFLAVFAAWYVLSLGGFKYIWWLFTQSWTYVIGIFVAVESIYLLLVGLIFAADVRITEMSSPAETIWRISFMLHLIVIWWGYRTGWKSYRQVGAQTTQMRYEEDVRKMEKKEAGQWWDRVVSLRMGKFFGFDGSKPHGGFIWCLFISLFLGSMGMLFFDMNLPTVGSLVIYVTPIFLIVLFAGISKYMDYRKNKRLPKLLRVRDENTDDSFDPERIGVKVF